MVLEHKEKYTIDDLLRIMEILRSPGGCPWDREQDHQSIRRNFLEEAYEAVEAIDLNDTGLLKEELGDVLMQVVFHARMEEELGSFDFSDVCDGVCKKLIVRHPHVFSDVVAETSEEVLRNWEDIKQQQKAQTTVTQTLESVPVTLPALMYCDKIKGRAAKAGFDYTSVEEAIADLDAETAELKEAIADGGPAHIADELGDVLFAVVNVARQLSVEPEEALTKACRKFIARFSTMEELAANSGRQLRDVEKAQLESLWTEAKNKGY